MLRVALIGFGSEANAIAAVSNRPSRVTLVDSHDNLGTAVEFLEQSRDSLDAVAIRCPLESRCDLGRAALLNGLHVLMTAPFGLSVADADAIADEATQRGLVVYPERTAHWHPYRRTIHDALNADQLGEPGLVRIHHWLGRDDPKPSTRLDQAFQAVDISDLGFNKPRRVFATTSGDVDHDQNDPLDYLQIHLGYANGSSALIDVAHIDAATGYQNVSLIGSDGAAYADDHANMHLAISDESVSAIAGGPSGMQHLLAQFEDFAVGVAAGSSGYFASLADVHHTALAVLKSLKDGTPVELKEN